MMALRFEGKQRSFSIGVYPEVRLIEARLARTEAKVFLRQGIDPNRAKHKKTMSRGVRFFTLKPKGDLTLIESTRQIEPYIITGDC